MMSNNEMGISRQVIRPVNHAPPAANYSPAMLVGLGGSKSFLFISGQVAKTPDGLPTAVGDPAGQTDVIFDLLDEILGEADGSIGDLVSLVIYLVDMSHFTAVSRVRAGRLGDPPPTSTLVQVNSLAKPEFLVEITATALLTATARQG
jgi:2-iminobutanoate/2-iminopropanoate deaminase